MVLAQSASTRTTLDPSGILPGFLGTTSGSVREVRALTGRTELGNRVGTGSTGCGGFK
jgi:hypothetical protein